MRRVPVVGAPISTGSLDEQVAAMIGWARKRQSRVVCVANVHQVMEAARDAALAEVLRQADLVTPDGMPLVWVMRRQGAPDQERVAGMDLVPALCAEAQARGVGIFFLGCTNEVLAGIGRRLERDYPRLKVAGLVSPPFRPLSPEEDEALVAQINASGAGLVLVALGCPKQERWMHEHRGRVQAVMVGVGAAFPVFAGAQGRAPLWMQRVGLEWLHRLGQEPRRLWKRYLLYNSLFLWRTRHVLLTSGVPRTRHTL